MARNGRNPTGVFLPGGFYGNVPGAGAYCNARSGDNSAFAGTGRIELDARTATPLGALRTFIRIESLFRLGEQRRDGLDRRRRIFRRLQFRQQHGLPQSARETTILNKAFIQFAGLTAGRVQSFFDFYVDDINWEVLRGSNATVGALGLHLYVRRRLLGNAVDRRQCVASRLHRLDRRAIQFLPPRRWSASWTSLRRLWQQRLRRSRRLADSRNCRQSALGSALGRSASLGAAHQIRTSLYGNNAVLATPVRPSSALDRDRRQRLCACRTSQEIMASPFNSARSSIWTNSRPKSSPPATNCGFRRVYEQGAVGYIMGNNLSFNGGTVNGNTFYGYGNGGVKANNGWDFNAYDCVWTALRPLRQELGLVAFLAALKHYWTPTLSSGVYGS